MFGPGAVHLLRAPQNPADYSPGRDRRDHRAPRPRRAAVEAAVLHLVGAGRAAPRGRRDDADGPPRRRPASGAALRGERAMRYSAAPPAELQRGRPHRQAVERREGRAVADRRADPPAAARLRGPDRLAAARSTTTSSGSSAPCARPASSQHADRLPLRQRLAAGRAPHPGRQVPALRGVAARPAHPPRARRAGRPDGPRPGLQRRLRADAARRRRRQGRAARMDGVSLLPRSARRASRPSARSRSRPCAAVRGRVPGSTPGTGPTRACAPTATPTSSTRETGEQELYDRRQDPAPAAQRRGRPGLRAGQGEARGRSSAKLDRCQGRSCNVRP